MRPASKYLSLGLALLGACSDTGPDSADPSTTDGSSSTQAIESDDTIGDTIGDTTGDGEETNSADSTSDGPEAIPDPLVEVWQFSTTGGSVEAICMMPDDSVVMAGADYDVLFDAGYAWVERVTPDGTSVWRTELTANAANRLWDVACAPDGTVTAVGGTGEANFFGNIWTVKLHGGTGATLLSSVGDSGELFGVDADSEGYVVAGDRPGLYVGSFTADDMPRWEYSASLDGVVARDVKVVDGTVFVSADDNGEEGRLLALDTSSGALLWQVPVGGEDFTANLVVRDPLAGGVLFGGGIEVEDWQDDAWVWPCTARGCAESAMSLPIHPVDGLAMDGAGNRILWGYDLEAFDASGNMIWQHDNDMFALRDLHDNLLAVDSTGAILLAGVEHVEGPPKLIKLVVE